MRKLIVEEWLSLDGFAEDRKGQLDFFPSSEENRYADERQLEFLDTIDTILLGRKTYELFVDYWPMATTDKEIIADKLNQTPKMVFTNSLKKAPWGTWPEAEVMSGDAVDAIRKLKLRSGKDMMLWGSISLTQALIKADLIDLYKIRLCPTVVGGGRPLFPVFDHYKSLKLVEQGSYENGLIYLSYTAV
ncbi:MAG TPA: dihydrofolate reductase family protein [Chryseolinea sp.]|nr:dihydrofolate reductase family protein [Chryseolinea sp.]